MYGYIDVISNITMNLYFSEHYDSCEYVEGFDFSVFAAMLTFILSIFSIEWFASPFFFIGTSDRLVFAMKIASLSFFVPVVPLFWYKLATDDWYSDEVFLCHYGLLAYLLVDICVNIKVGECDYMDFVVHHIAFFILGVLPFYSTNGEFFKFVLTITFYFEVANIFIALISLFKLFKCHSPCMGVFYLVFFVIYFLVRIIASPYVAWNYIPKLEGWEYYSSLLYVIPQVLSFYWFGNMCYNFHGVLCGNKYLQHKVNVEKLD